MSVDEKNVDKAVEQTRVIAMTVCAAIDSTLHRLQTIESPETRHVCFMHTLLLIPDIVSAALVQALGKELDRDTVSKIKETCATFNSLTTDLMMQLTKDQYAPGSRHGHRTMNHAESEFKNVLNPPRNI